MVVCVSARVCVWYKVCMRVCGGGCLFPTPRTPSETLPTLILSLVQSLHLPHLPSLYIRPPPLPLLSLLFHALFYHNHSHRTSVLYRPWFLQQLSARSRSFSAASARRFRRAEQTRGPMEAVDLVKMSSIIEHNVHMDGWLIIYIDRDFNYMVKWTAFHLQEITNYFYPSNNFAIAILSR